MREPLTNVIAMSDIVQKLCGFCHTLRHDGVVDQFAPSLLARAFVGQLVPQDDGDEPAAELLERIRVGRKA